MSYLVAERSAVSGECRCLAVAGLLGVLSSNWTRLCLLCCCSWLFIIGSSSSNSRGLWRCCDVATYFAPSSATNGRPYWSRSQSVLPYCDNLHTVPVQTQFHIHGFSYESQKFVAGYIVYVCDQDFCKICGWIFAEFLISTCVIQHLHRPSNDLGSYGTFDAFNFAGLSGELCQNDKPVQTGFWQILLEKNPRIGKWWFISES